MTTVESPHTAQSCGAHGVYDLEHGKIRRAHIFADRTEALEPLGLSE
jgi:hypothetical protein